MALNSRARSECPECELRLQHQDNGSDGRLGPKAVRELHREDARFVRDPVIASKILAAACLNGGFSRRVTATIFGVLQRRVFCARAA